MRDEDFFERIQTKAENHLEACFEALNAQDEGIEMDSPAFGPFDGCETCIVREVLSVCWEEMLAEAKREASQ